MSQNALKAVEPTPLARPDAGAIMEQVIVKGDLSALKPEERARYYVEVCRSLGVNELTKPFEYITLNNKLTLYATRTATDQLRTVNRVSVRVTSREHVGDLYIVTVEATTPDGRSDSDIGAVNVAGLKGDALANALMKATTKAKRRVTLSIVGLGWLDETEIETVPGARVVPVDVATGEVLEAAVSEPEPVEGHATGEQDAARLSTVGDMKKLHAEAANRGLNHEDVHALAAVIEHVESITAMSRLRMDAFTKWLQEVKPGELDKWLTKAGRPTVDERLAEEK